MDYEKRYKDALERAKKLYGQGTITESLDFVFPELNEKSYGERIRKELIEHIKANKEADYLLFKKFSPDDVIAWLEKQKDVSSVERVFRPIVGCDITCAATQAIKQRQLGYKIVLAFNGAYIPIEEKTADDIVNEYYSWLKKQGELNPIDKVEPKFHKGEIGHVNEYVHPATKEQRDLLFEKMKNAGYEWDVEKKELKKISPKTLDPDKVIEWLEDQACQGWIEDIEVEKFVDKFKKDFGL